MNMNRGDLAARVAHGPKGGGPESGRPDSVRVVYVGDFARRCDAVRRVVEEVLMSARLGFETGLAHVPATDHDARPDPSILEVLEKGLATALDYERPVEAELAIVVDPARAFDRRPPLPFRVMAERVLAVLDRPVDIDRIRAKDRRLIQYFGDVVSWSATAYDVLGRIRDAGVTATGSVWQPFGAIAPTPDRNAWNQGSRPRIGMATDAGAEHWPASDVALQQIWDSRSYRVRVIGQPPATGHTESWEVLSPHERQHMRFASGLNALLYYPDDRPDDLPLTVIGACLAGDIPVFLPGHLKPAIGKGPIYAPPSRVREELRRELASTDRPSTARFDALEVHRRRMSFWLRGQPSGARLRRGRRILFFPSNGDGLGHVTRLLAIARRLPANVQPVFASLSHGIGLIEEAGYHAEMIASHRYANLEERYAYPWMAEELSEILARHAPDVFVFDGSNPYGFVTDVVAKRREMAFVWVRRGMWLEQQNNAAFLAKEKFFDAVLEPSDLASGLDRGITATRREGVVLTDPVRLIEDDEQLSREDARAELGLDPDSPAVLIQLGPGNRQDGTLTYNRVVAAFDGLNDVQLVHLRSPIARNAMDDVAGVRTLSAYPVARYLRAFDFAVSAAGYNSFHELLICRVPTIFVIGMTADLDDQLGRASYAESKGCGFALDDKDLGSLPDLVSKLLDPAVRESMRHNCSRFASTNGARQMSDLLAEIAG